MLRKRDGEKLQCTEGGHKGLGVPPEWESWFSSHSPPPPQASYPWGERQAAQGALLSKQAGRAVGGPSTHHPRVASEAIAAAGLTHIQQPSGGNKTPGKAGNPTSR